MSPRPRRNPALTMLICALICHTRCVPATASTPPRAPVDPAAAAQQACRLDWYRYDRTLPLNAAVKPLDTTASSVRYRLDYDSVHDQRVPAILALPSHFAPPYPAVLLLHGAGGNKDTSYIKAASEMLTALGCAALAIDSQYQGDRKRPGRSGDIFLPNSYTARDAWVQTVIDLRRAVDYLQTRSDIDRARLGYLGFSQGAMLGAVFGGVDSRVAVFCLAVPGGGLLDVVRHIDRYPLLRQHWPIQITPEVMQTVQHVTNITDPIYYVAAIAPRPLLILTAKYDEIIPEEASEALVARARADPALQVKEIASGHILNPEVIFTIRDFFKAQFGNRTPGRPPAP